MKRDGAQDAIGSDTPRYCPDQRGVAGGSVWFTSCADTFLTGSAGLSMFHFWVRCDFSVVSRECAISIRRVTDSGLQLTAELRFLWN